ncbi:palmitoyl-acyl carrier protein thioesterase, chloroplastic-like [Bidens hawaiensis]|uniref:palmitoyl-acyl carrier protein thioesterase, chloroplastic-like n=1 Tax=Bidens hawaiensis TaxID=980011 RepID=UPI00404B75ED
MATGASYMPISSSYHGLGAMIPSKLGGISTILEARNNKRKYASSCSWRLRLQTNANIPAKWMMHNHNISHPTLDHNGLGCKVHDDSLFDLPLTVRSYEIGADGKASIETIMNYFQEAIANIEKVLGGETGDGPGSLCKDLTWVVTKIQVEVDRYPAWGDVVRVIKPYLSIPGKHSLHWDMVICDYKTSEVLARATSNMAVLNKSTKRLSKIPDEIRVTLNQFFVEKPYIIVKDTRIWPKLDETTADHVCSGLMPRWSDLDIRKHVNNVKYIGWILESIPESYMKNYELASMALAYHKECEKDCVLQSLTSILRTDNNGSNHVDCHHMLRLEEDGSVVVKGWTRWRPKIDKC